MYEFAKRDFRLPLLSRCELRLSRLLRSEKWEFITDVSGQQIGPIFRGQEFVKVPDARHCCGSSNWSLPEKAVTNNLL
jgi:hypothetical protein